MLALKNLHLGTSSLVFCPESNVSKLERCEDVQACGNLMGNVRIMAESFVVQGSSLPPSWTTAVGIVNRIATHAVTSFAVSSEKSWRVIANATKSLRKVTSKAREHAINQTRPINCSTTHAYWHTYFLITSTLWPSFCYCYVNAGTRCGTALVPCCVVTCLV